MNGQYLCEYAIQFHCATKCYHAFVHKHNDGCPLGWCEKHRTDCECKSVEKPKEEPLFQCDCSNDNCKDRECPHSIPHPKRDTCLLNRSRACAERGILVCCKEVEKEKEKKKEPLLQCNECGRKICDDLICPFRLPHKNENKKTRFYCWYVSREVSLVPVEEKEKEPKPMPTKKQSVCILCQRPDLLSAIDVFERASGHKIGTVISCKDCVPTLIHSKIKVEYVESRTVVGIVDGGLQS